jgi:hypothetical protein
MVQKPQNVARRRQLNMTFIILVSGTPVEENISKKPNTLSRGDDMLKSIILAYFTEII